MRQNLAFAFLYNATGEPIAAGVLYSSTAGGRSAQRPCLATSAALTPGRLEFTDRGRRTPDACGFLDAHARSLGGVSWSRVGLVVDRFALDSGKHSPKAGQAVSCVPPSVLRPRSGHPRVPITYVELRYALLLRPARFEVVEVRSGAIGDQSVPTCRYSGIHRFGQQAAIDVQA